ncbi:uncharacterized protein LOC128739395 [Sabethes cyaneus]|uniref:uncharacterized protein LOC128739395 n=1 Tax=Sabethes cyaneus TaxID=53552 RepID=UPI00237EC4DF|nr:uncharacterized protein LOC128739395 [Sabethes cyaneus]
MRWFTVNNLLEARRPIYRVMQAFCLTSITINFKDLTAEQTTTDQLRLIAGLGLCCATIYYTYGSFRVQLQEMSDSNILSVGLYGTTVVLVVSLVTNIIANYANGTRIFRCNMILNKFDQQLNTYFGCRWNYQKEHRNGVLVIAVGYIQWILLMLTLRGGRVTVVLEWHTVLISMCCFIWVMLSYQSTGIVFTSTIQSIRKRFLKLNKLISHLLPTSSTVDLQSRDPETCRRMIRKIAILHDQLCDAVELFNRCFTGQAMVSLATAFGFTAFSMFGLIHSCGCSLFDFDWSLFYTIASSLTTYLVILVQFDLINYV